MKNEVAYEWDFETTFINEDGETEIIDHHHSEKLADLKWMVESGVEGRIVLIRETGNEDDGLDVRQWAYPEDSILPDEFDQGNKVPKRFKYEFDKFNNKV